MIRWLLGITICGGMLVVAGCGGQSGLALPPQVAERKLAKPPSNEELPLVDHPEYIHWIQFPIGTAVTRKKEVSNEHGAVLVMTTIRLTEKTAEKVVIETQVTVDRHNGEVESNPPFNTEFAAKFRLPPSVQLEQFSLPSLRAKVGGEDARTICGHEYPALVFTWDERNETGPMAVKLWWSNEVPGRMVRQEIDGHQHHSIEEPVEIAVPLPSAE